MRITPSQFINSFDAEYGKDRQNTVFDDLVTRSNAGRGGDVAITMPARAGTIEFTACANVRDHNTLKTLMKALENRICVFRPGCWFEDGALQAGVLCHVEGVVVATMSIRKVVHITIERREFDLVVDGSH